MTEQIGKITLDYKYYQGQDLYCDGTIEDELLDIVQNCQQEEYAGVIEKRENWPILYHLSPLRENIIDWIPMESSAKVLEVGSGCGAITGALSRKANTVTCIDLSKKRSHINAHRHKTCDNVTIKVGNFTDIEPELPQDYDYIFLIGVFEYGQSYIGTQNPYEEFLAIIKKHLKADGRIIIAIENKFGLKYFAGCKEDHLGTYFSGIEDYATGGGVRTFSRNRLEQILQANEVREYEFYYPYPDYKFMTTVYSDEYLPKVGELSNNMRNFDRDRMLLFDEKNAFDGIIRDNMFSDFSNSFLVVIGKPLPVKYAKFSNDRAEQFEIRTNIGRDERGQYYVEKAALSEAAVSHIAKIEEAYELLKERYRGSRLEINRCRKQENTLRFEYVEGISLEEIFDTLLEKEAIEDFYDLFREYVQIIDYNSNSQISNYDLIFSNILIQGDKWTVIDYEWTVEKRIPTKKIAYRAFYCYSLGSEKRRKLNEDLILGILQMSSAEAEEIKEEEREFQSYVTGKRLPIGEMHRKIGNEVLSPYVWEAKYKDNLNKERVQVYEDLGVGFTEEASYFLQDAYRDCNKITVTIPLSEKVRKVRIDPALDSCIVTLEKVELNGVPFLLKGKNYMTNGIKCAEKTIVFATIDPNMTFDLQGVTMLEANEFSIEMNISRVPLTIAESFQDKKRGKFIHAAQSKR